jgi:SAM-dependent methyltransferase
VVSAGVPLRGQVRESALQNAIRPTACSAIGLHTESFDLVTAVASLHHMDAAAVLEHMRDLLRPGGVLAVVGLAREITPAEAILRLRAIPGNDDFEAYLN